VERPHNLESSVANKAGGADDKRVLLKLMVVRRRLARKL